MGQVARGRRSGAYQRRWALPRGSSLHGRWRRPGCGAQHAPWRQRRCCASRWSLDSVVWRPTVRSALRMPRRLRIYGHCGLLSIIGSPVCWCRGCRRSCGQSCVGIAVDSAARHTKGQAQGGRSGTGACCEPCAQRTERAARDGTSAVDGMRSAARGLSQQPSGQRRVSRGRTEVVAAHHQGHAHDVPGWSWARYARARGRCAVWKWMGGG